MRAIIVVAIVVLVLALVGWIQFSSPDGNPTIQIDTEKVKEDTSTLVEKAKGAAEEVDRRVDVDVDTSPKPASE
ncbi:hypothetical protein FF011L_32540 [Roseimaritima multifibrata]|uniref:Uncharacterized protein n=1 Tax=Roseimaritima multifibrata TaxID=1930274 RepID=A0A517MHX4_9BACT|nr:hypothetical protein [Roseimaritima multifibrata]QDS94475.1 hypothetical protein FF011L_32540 [Roseimaritima multifibrata]